MKKFGLILCLVGLFLQGCNALQDKAQTKPNKDEKTVSETTPIASPVERDQKNEILIDSDLSLTEAIGNQSVPDQIRKELVLVEVEYYAPDGKLHRGQLVIHQSLKEEIVEIFGEIKEAKFPLAKVIPVSHYNFSDDKSMEDNNTSSFNYRVIEGSNKLSNHALGRALDINPLFNPLVKNGETKPRTAKYDAAVLGTITADSVIVKLFKQRGWSWGGDWKQLKDYQHFEKP
jgi:peptidoglycan L-alanyl-D-glutamate endopeptidase CwlK